MMKSVLLSIKPKYCALIANGKKTLEVRKNRPKIEVPFKCYIYCTKETELWVPVKNRQALEHGDGKVIGEFVCDNIKRFDVPYPAFYKELDKKIIEESCLTYWQLHKYTYHDDLYAWHISDLMIYDTPKELSEFYRKCENDCGNVCKHWKYMRVNAAEFDMDCDCGGLIPVSRPPQSWCYVKEVSKC